MTKVSVDKLSTHTFNWGLIKWFVTAEKDPGAKLSFGEVILLPGEGHSRHNHPNSEEIIYVLSGVALQMVDDKPEYEVKAGDTIYIPTGVYHSTLNTGWEPLRVLVVYNPGDAYKDLSHLEDHREVATGQIARLTRT